MTSLSWLPLAFLAFAALGACILLHRRRALNVERAWRPQALANAPIAFAEKTFHISHPLRLTAKADRGFVVDNAVVLTELKTRRFARAYDSDVIELSAQKLAVEGASGRTVHTTAYVIVEQPMASAKGPRRHWIPVRLMDAATLVALARRRASILRGDMAPQEAHSEGLCVKCPYIRECRPARLRHQRR